MLGLLDLLRLKISGYIIIDNFFPDDICTELREKSLNAKEYNDKYWDYQSLDFDDIPTNPSLKYISDKYIIPKVSLAKNYFKAWTFVYDNVALGVLPHADRSFININVWVTPDECVYDHNKNGLKIYKKKAPKEWTWEQYNTSIDLIEDFLKGSKYDIIPYKYNRAIIFKGDTFHATDNVHMKPGHENKRVNYTFLYE
tara:strand:+ start:69 stop:662 length:594 start_codon:yes stop_codon:yes gene_type:complete